MVSHLLAWPPVLLSFLSIALYVILLSFYVYLSWEPLFFSYICASLSSFVFYICVFIPFFVLRLCFSSSLLTHLHGQSRIASSIFGLGLFFLSQDKTCRQLIWICLHVFGFYLVILMLKLYFVLCVINSVTPPVFHLNQPKEQFCLHVWNWTCNTYLEFELKINF